MHIRFEKGGSMNRSKIGIIIIVLLSYCSAYSIECERGEYKIAVENGSEWTLVGYNNFYGILFTATPGCFVEVCSKTDHVTIKLERHHNGHEKHFFIEHDFDRNINHIFVNYAGVISINAIKHTPPPLLESDCLDRVISEKEQHGRYGKYGIYHNNRRSGYSGGVGNASSCTLL